MAHGEYAAQAMTKLGTATVNAHYPNDHTHTDAFMANVMAGKSTTYQTLNPSTSNFIQPAKPRPQ